MSNMSKIKQNDDFYINADVDILLAGADKRLLEPALAVARKFISINPSALTAPSVPEEPQLKID
jgi:hypothetical protein